VGCAGLALLFPVGLALLVALFYLEEDWRGARAWEQAKVDIEAQGETLDPAKFIPAPVPDAENFGALPYFKVVSYPGGIDGTGSERFAIYVTLKTITDHIAMSQDASKSEDTLPYLGNWLKGLPADSHDFTARMEAFLKREQPNTTIPDKPTPFEIFELICPSLADLRSAEQTHPDCEFPAEINYREPHSQKFGTDTTLISLDKVLVYDAQLAILEHRPEIALEDLRVGWKATSGEQNRPYNVSSLVATAIIAIQLGAIEQDLAIHVWNEKQLTELQSDLEKIDYLGESRRQLNGEIACYNLPLIDYYASHRSTWAKDTSLMASLFVDEGPLKDTAYRATYLLIPDGWFDLAKADVARRKIEELRRIDLAQRQVHPGPDPEKSSDPAIQWLDFITPDLNLVRDLEKQIAYAQVQLDEAGIACRLERYRLAHGAYPATLDVLAAAYGPLAHDLMNGETYHYRLNPDQTYILYSVGWNQIDDHGNAGNVRKWDSPDWIWTNYPNQK
jgi:hypothetical protein